MSLVMACAIRRSTSDMPRLIEWLCFCTSRMPCATSQSKVREPWSMIKLCSLPISAIFWWTLA